MDKKTEILQLLDKAKEQHGLEKAATIADILRLVGDPLSEEDGSVFELEFQITFGDGVELDAVSVSSDILSKFRQIDEIQTATELRKFLAKEAIKDMDKTPVYINLVGLGRTKIKITGKIGSEEWFQLINRIHGLEAKKLTAKKVVAAISCMREIVSKGLQTSRAPDIHKDDPKKAKSIVFYIKENMNLPELGTTGIVLTIKKKLAPNAEMEAHHVHVQGNVMYVRKRAEAEGEEVGGFVYANGERVVKRAERA